MIKSYFDKVTEDIANGFYKKRVGHAVARQAQRRLVYLNNAKSLDDLRVPPGNRLELLKGDRVGQHSIRVNNQWRLCFRWENGHVYDVELVDYH